MTPPLESLHAPDVVYRLGKGPDPWEWPPWEYAKPDGTFGNRWDDSQGVYRVLYAGSERLGTFVETLGRFRPDAAVLAGVAEVADDPGFEGPSALRSGEVSRTWLTNRRLGRAAVAGEFLQIGHSASLAWLHEALAERLVYYNVNELDAATIRLSVPRELTQEISRAVFDLTVDGRRQFAGISYLSRLGDEFQNWAIFEPAEIELEAFSTDLSAGDPDFLKAVDRLGLTLVD